jgi:hypothetical protein
VLRKYLIRHPSRADWHDRRECGSLRKCLPLVKIALVLMHDAVRWASLRFRSPDAIQAENLFLRRQLALFLELRRRGSRAPSIDRT